jgi:hypothetical protein
MISYRQQLAKIGIGYDEAVSYQAFYSRPRSLRQAIRSMDAPAGNSWKQVSDIFRDDFWTDEVQGVAWDGTHWIFSANANQLKPGHEDKAIYVFKGGETLSDGNWVSRIKYKDVPHPISGTTESDDHWGQLTFFEGRVYVAHFWAGDPPKAEFASVVVFKDTNGVLEYEDWIELEKPTSPTDNRTERAEFQAINPWDGMLYTCFGAGDIHEFFIHHREGPKAGQWTGKALTLDQPVKFVQGACFSANGHLYIATNAKLPGDARYQTIWYYAALNGHQFGVIPVLAEESEDDDPAVDDLAQELEGICFANVSVPGGQGAQIHAVLLENELAALDDIFFKSFASSTPDLV